MNEYFSRPRTLGIHEGPLSSCIDDFAAMLQERGYAPRSVHPRIRLVSDFGRWLHRDGYKVEDVSQESVDQYLQHRFHLRSGKSDSTADHRLIDVLRQMGIIAGPLPTVIRTAWEEVLNDFQLYLLQERGLSPATLDNYLPFARQLLTERFTGNSIELSQLCATDITGFVLHHAQCLSRKRALLMTSALRSFLRFLHLRGDIGTDLAACVPSVPSWSLSEVPKYLRPNQVQCISDHCDQKTAVVRRDDAILLLLVRLGLRSNAQAAEWARRLGFVRGFARYRSATDPRTEVPPWGLLPHRSGRARPYFYADEEIRSLLNAGRRLAPADGMRPWNLLLPVWPFGCYGPPY